MKIKTLFAILTLFLTLGLTGCGGSSTKDNAIYDALKKSFTGRGTELKTAEEIQEALFYERHNPWRVTSSTLGELRERVIRVLALKGFGGTLSINDAYYDFRYDYNSRVYILTIYMYCVINQINGTLKIDCGEVRFTSDKTMSLRDNWWVGFDREDGTKYESSWSYQYYSKKDIESNNEKFVSPEITYASEYDILMTSGIYLESDY